MLSPPDSPRGKLLSQYVLARVVRMDGINIGLFEYDRHNPLYYFILNGDEQIYLRYGGRDPSAVDSHLSLESIELALAKGLELHEQYQAGKLAKKPKPEPVYPSDFALLRERTTERGRCVECHLIGDFTAMEADQKGEFDRISGMYRSPDFKNIGIGFDVPKGLVLAETDGAAAAAGMAAGDLITHFEGTPVWTFGDLQYLYDKTDRFAEQVTMTVSRDGIAKDVSIALPKLWWYSDLLFRQWSIEPRVYFESRPLSEEEKAARGVDSDIASEVVKVDPVAELMGAHELEAGDVITAVDGASTDPVADRAELYIKLRKQAGATVQLTVRRGDQTFETPLKTARMSFRK